MAGIENDVLVGKNLNFNNSAAPPHLGIINAAGKLPIGTGNLSPTPEILGGLITSPDSSLTIGYSSPNITAIVNRAVVQDLHTARFIVSVGGSTDGANFTTIQAAINAAAGTGVNQTVFIQPGTYTEDLTLNAGVNLVAYTGDAFTPNVTIIGKATFTTAGTVSISNIQLQTNSDFLVAVTGSAASVLYLIQCTINASNNTAISFTSSSAAAQLLLISCIGALGTTGIAYFSGSTAGSMVIQGGFWRNAGGSSTANTFASSGTLILNNLLNFQSPLAVSGTSIINISNSRINSSGTNTIALAFTSTGGSCSIAYSLLSSGTAAAMTIGAGAAMTVDYLRVDSTNAAPLSGAGILKYGSVDFLGTFNNTVTTQTHTPLQNGGWSLISTLTASASTSLDFTTIPVFSVYAFVITNLRPATNAQKLELLVSNNNGGAFAVTGYTAGINYTSYNSAVVTNVNATTFAALTSNTNSGTGVSGTVFITPANGLYWGETSYLSTDSAVSAFGSCGGATGLVANAFRIIMSSGNLTSGSVSLYGINT